MSRGHVAVVSQIITDRYIQVTHANWSPINGRRGQVEDNVNVLDVSEKGDWSLVKVWYGPTNDLGTTVYTTYGFIYQDPNNVRMGDDVTTMIAQAEPAAAPKPAATQIAMNTAPVSSPSAKDLPADLQAALTPGNHKGFQSVKPVQVTAHVTGKPAAELVAQIDADNEAAGRPVAKVKASKSSKSKARVRTKLKD